MRSTILGKKTVPKKKTPAQPVEKRSPDEKKPTHRRDFVNLLDDAILGTEKK